MKIKRITIKFSSAVGESAFKKGGGMWERNILDNFTKRQEKKLKVFPKYINGNFIVLNLWMLEKKEFNKNSKLMRLNFWKELKAVAKNNNITYYEEDLK